MERNTKIAIGLLAGGTALLGYSYYRGAKQLQFHLQNVQLRPDGKLHVTLHVQNNSGFGYPVPMLDLGVFDTSDNYLGTIQSNILQYIPAGGGLIEGTVLPNYNNVFSTLTGYALGTLPTNIIVQGYVRAGNFSIPVTAQVLSA